MLMHVPFIEIGERHLEGIAKCLELRPPSEQTWGTLVLMELHAGTMHLFDWTTGFIVAAKRSTRLTMEAFCAPEISMEECRNLVSDLKRLAADWQCDTIETMVYDSRLTSVIHHLGGEIESWVMVLPVEPENVNQHEN